MMNGAKPVVSANRALMQTSIPGLELLGRGKVRDIYEVELPDGTKALLIVATDRISIYDVILPTPIPDKGRILTGMTLFWLDFIKDIVPNHLITADVDMMASDGIIPVDSVEMLRGRTMLCRRARVIPVECVVRGYLAGSGWKEYQGDGKVCGINCRPASSSASACHIPSSPRPRKLELAMTRTSHSSEWKHCSAMMSHHGCATPASTCT